MKLFKRISIIIGILICTLILFKGIRVGMVFYKNYQFTSALSDTVFDQNISEADAQEASSLPFGKLHCKESFRLQELPPLWEKLSQNDALKEQYQYLNQLDFSLITYKSNDQLVYGIVAEPKRDGKFPVIIFNKGGNKYVGKEAKGRTLYTLLFAASKLASEGYVIVASCYREDDQFGGNDVQDVLALIETAKEFDKAQPERLGMYGWSRGGMMTYLALKKTDAIKTAVVGNGPADLFTLIEDRPSMESKVYAKLIPDYEHNKDEALKNRSVIYWPDQLSKQSSLLILCGTQDERVNPAQADSIAKKLHLLDYDFQLKKYKTDHGFSTKTDELHKELIDWFSEKL